MEFLSSIGSRGGRDWLGQSCSLLEVLVALSRRAEFESEKDAYTWFWQMMQNVGLRDFTDAVYDDWVREEVLETMARVIDREYGNDGAGGLFPLQNPDQDQREVELWYQMSSYLIENSTI
jgi:hypothetical protein